METENRRFKEVRKKHGLTQQEFADKLGLSLPVVQKVEQGGGKVTLVHAQQLHKHFAVSLDWLFGYSDEPGDEEQGPKTMGDIARVLLSLVNLEGVEYSISSGIRKDEKEACQVSCADELTLYLPGILGRPSYDGVSGYPDYDNRIWKLVEPTKTIAKYLQLRETLNGDNEVIGPWLEKRLCELDAIPFKGTWAEQATE